MTNDIPPRLAPVEVDREPRILDLALASLLGFERPRAIRQLIHRNKAELEGFGSLPYRAGLNLPHGVANSKRGRGRPSSECWLNEPQALLLCMFSNTPNAAAVRKQVIKVFMDWRAGKTVHVKEHRRRPPAEVMELPAYEFTISQRAAGDPISVQAAVPLSMALQFMAIFKDRVELALTAE